MYTVHVRGADLPFFMRFVNIGTDNASILQSQSQPYSVCTRVIYLT